MVHYKVTIDDLVGQDMEYKIWGEFDNIGSGCIPPGSRGHAIDFDSSHNYVSIELMPAGTAATFSSSNAWLRVDSNDGNQTIDIVEKYNESSLVEAMTVFCYPASGSASCATTLTYKEIADQ
ncbi:MAG: hypothetical protein GY765_06515 [bacterium]|nr:hypothetical protein [bacterium]